MSFTKQWSQFVYSSTNLSFKKKLCENIRCIFILWKVSIHLEFTYSCVPEQTGTKGLWEKSRKLAYVTCNQKKHGNQERTSCKPWTYIWWPEFIVKEKKKKPNNEYFFCFSHRIKIGISCGKQVGTSFCANAKQIAVTILTNIRTCRSLYALSHT